MKKVASEKKEIETLEGTVKSVVFHNDETLYTVLRIELPSRFELRHSREAMVVCKTQAVWEGEEVQAEGYWVNDKEYGRQFKAENITCLAPKSLLGIERYLSSGLIKGVGKVIAKKIVKVFGEDTLNILNHQSARLGEVPKLGAKKIAQIRESWHKNATLRENMIFGQTYGISISRMTRIVKKYGPDAIAVIKANPYRLCREIWGIGFSTADKIAMSIGIEKESPLRARAAISYTLETEAEDGGHCWTYENDLLLRANELTSISVEILSQALEDEINSSHVVAERDEEGDTRKISLWSLSRAEKRTADKLRQIMKTPSSFKKIDAPKAVAWWEAKAGFRLANRQSAALEKSLESKISIITGGPGVGKTTIIRALVEIYKARKINVVLAAPTGRAAKRMSESVGCPAQTIHRLLKWNPVTNKFTFDAANSLEGEVFIFDETSMIDIRLAADLFAAIPVEASIVMVGDTDQLPSVGPGSVLGDMIASGKIPCTKLNEIFRQKGTGLIVLNAHHVNAGEPLETRPDEESDFYFSRARDPGECLRRAIEFMQTRIPRKFGMNPLEDVQVLTPMRRGLLGADNINTEIQNALNPNGEGLERGGSTFRKGDRVMQLRNNYDKDVYNGDIGFIKSVEKSSRSLVVTFDGRDVKYDASDLDELVLAYATTIHKSQGSEYPAVIVIIHTQHYIMLQRNLLYTAITRGRRLVLLLGVPYAVSKAIETNTVRERRTSLAKRL
ncbi:MAG: ATP-dependent RecD-like DNA helicase [Kiritimatiellae bacterium]|nr:ATP-dependent RecD-like DNA helicase [Kiritimatiellia bacterium]